MGAVTGLVVVVPSRGRPHAVAELAETFRTTCTADTELVFAVDGDDPLLEQYLAAAREALPGGLGVGVCGAPSTMVRALDQVAAFALEHHQPEAVAFMGDDHRPRTEGWDAAYLDALRTTPGLVYGNDLIQRSNLPTQVAMSAGVVRALGHMAPPTLTHLYVDNYWRDLGRACHCLTYLPDVVVEHVHPVAGKAEWDEGYRRVNDRSMYAKDALAYQDYWLEFGGRDVEAVTAAAR